MAEISDRVKYPTIQPQTTAPSGGRDFASTENVSRGWRAGIEGHAGARYEDEDLVPRLCSSERGGFSGKRIRGAVAKPRLSNQQPLLSLLPMVEVLSRSAFHRPSTFCPSLVFSLTKCTTCLMASMITWDSRRQGASWMDVRSMDSSACTLR
jgi:hypothetical protein